MTTVTEGQLQLTFPTGWDAVGFDQTAWHQKRFGHYHAVDILAAHQGRHWWIEIKDCQGYESANRPRLSPLEPTEVPQTRTWIKGQGWAPIVSARRRKPFIVDEVIAKVRDTLVSLSFAKRAAEPALADFSSLAGSQEPLVIVLLLTWEITDFKRVAKLLQQKLNTALAPYNLKGFVVDETLHGCGITCSVVRIP